MTGDFFFLSSTNATPELTGALYQAIATWAAALAMTLSAKRHRETARDRSLIVITAEKLVHFRLRLHSAVDWLVQPTVSDAQLLRRRFWQADQSECLERPRAKGYGNLTLFTVANHRQLYSLTGR